MTTFAIILGILPFIGILSFFGKWAWNVARTAPTKANHETEQMKMKLAYQLGRHMAVVMLVTSVLERY